MCECSPSCLWLFGTLTNVISRPEDDNANEAADDDNSSADQLDNLAGVANVLAQGCAQQAQQHANVCQNATAKQLAKRIAIVSAVTELRCVYWGGGGRDKVTIVSLVCLYTQTQTHIRARTHKHTSATGTANKVKRTAVRVAKLREMRASGGDGTATKKEANMVKAKMTTALWTWNDSALITAKMQAAAIIHTAKM